MSKYAVVTIYNNEVESITKVTSLVTFDTKDEAISFFFDEVSEAFDGEQISQSDKDRMEKENNFIFVDSDNFYIIQLKEID